VRVLETTLDCLFFFEQTLELRIGWLHEWSNFGFKNISCTWSGR
jgi:hypothetical protein